MFCFLRPSLESFYKFVLRALNIQMGIKGWQHRVRLSELHNKSNSATQWRWEKGWKVLKKDVCCQANGYTGGGFEHWWTDRRSAPTFYTYLGINQATSSAYLVMRSIQSINPEKYYILDSNLWVKSDKITWIPSRKLMLADSSLS